MFSVLVGLFGGSALVIGALNKTGPNRRRFYSVFEDDANNFVAISTGPLDKAGGFRSARLPYKPHSMFSTGHYVVGVEKAGRGATVLRDVDGQVALHFHPPDSSIWFYGHGIAHHFDSQRFYVSAYRPVPGYSDMAVTSGMLLEYQLTTGKGGAVSVSFVRSHETDGYVPHHMQYSQDGRLLHYAIKNDPQRRSRLVSVDARTLRVEANAVVGTGINGTQISRRITHLNVTNDGIIYVFSEVDAQNVLLGGGIGALEKNNLSKVRYEWSYTEVLGRRRFHGSVDHLDLVVVDGRPMITIPAHNLVCRLDPASGKFEAIEVAGLCGLGIAPSDRRLDRPDLFASTRFGIEQGDIAGDRRLIVDVGPKIIRSSSHLLIL